MVATCRKLVDQILARGSDQEAKFLSSADSKLEPQMGKGRAREQIEVYAA